MYSLNCRGKLLTLKSLLVMGIINITPDSFIKRRIQQLDDILAKTKQIAEGADIIDIGGQSTAWK